MSDKTLRERISSLEMNVADHEQLIGRLLDVQTALPEAVIAIADVVDGLPCWCAGGLRLRREGWQHTANCLALRAALEVAPAPTVWICPLCNYTGSDRDHNVHVAFRQAERGEPTRPDAPAPTADAATEGDPYQNLGAHARQSANGTHAFDPGCKFCLRLYWEDQQDRAAQ